MNILTDIVTYPKTHHIDGSKFRFSHGLKKGLEELKRIKLFEGKKVKLLIEEKMDGSQLGIFFKGPTEPVFYSRGSIIEASDEFSLAKQWVYSNIEKLWELLGQRFILFGEWLYLKHTIFYDALPAYFMEYDVYDRRVEQFLSTEARQSLFRGHDYIHSVRVIAHQVFDNASELEALVGASAFISSESLARLKANVEGVASVDSGRVLEETDLTGLMEGLYIKVEKDSYVQERYKYIRYEFLSKILSSNTHWRARVQVTNAVKNL
ncbi:RNA ligase family protein [Teredinibacter sp. KSP-S5-2]|uniref:RNA ligase family protein n=1 Tax=Teredinibacter sp. KSP-S5-2 TaxID=3034506 RepID=UPI0029349C0D|nr:RNA ligase family protein [Teredinibacter sp. KSP-S5-2]WNO10851.1 RNA ligase family protein [Teredinibacter sp. KSP-S5-2]